MITFRCEMYEGFDEKSPHQLNEALMDTNNKGEPPFYYYTVTNEGKTFHFCSLFCLHVWSEPK